MPSAPDKKKPKVFEAETTDDWGVSDINPQEVKAEVEYDDMLEPITPNIPDKLEGLTAIFDKLREINLVLKPVDLMERMFNVQDPLEGKLNYNHVEELEMQAMKLIQEAKNIIAQSVNTPEGSTSANDAVVLMNLHDDIKKHVKMRVEQIIENTNNIPAKAVKVTPVELASAKQEVEESKETRDMRRARAFFKTIADALHHAEPNEDLKRLANAVAVELQRLQQPGDVNIKGSERMVKLMEVVNKIDERMQKNDPNKAIIRQIRDKAEIFGIKSLNTSTVNKQIAKGVQPEQNKPKSCQLFAKSPTAPKVSDLINKFQNALPGKKR